MGKWLSRLIFATAGLFALNLASAVFASPADAATVTGTVYDANLQPVNQSWLKISNTSSNSTYETWISNGTFSIDLNDGNYTMDAYWDSSANQTVQLDSTKNVTFSVYGSTVSPSPLVAQAAGANVTGAVYDANNQLLSGTDYLYLHPDGSYDNKIQAKVNSGRFSLSLNDGKYDAEGYWDSTGQQYVDLGNMPFTVTGATYVDLHTPADNVTGTLTDAQGSVDGVQLNLYNTNTNAWYSTKVTGGAFNLHLGDGSYQVDGYWDPNTQTYVQFDSSVSGRTFTLSSTSPNATVNLTVPAPNVTGTLKDSSGNAVDNVWLHIYSNTVGKQAVYFADVKNGSFSLHLPSGDYTAAGYWDNVNNVQVTLNEAFTVDNTGTLVDGGAVSGGVLNLQVQAPNVSGSINGLTLNSGSLSLHDTSTYKGYSTSIKNNKFSLYLPNGTYAVEGLWDSDTQEYDQLEAATITVSGGQLASPVPLVLQVPQKNVQGTLKLADGSNADQVWLDMHKNDQSGYHYYNALVKNGAFSLSLGDGNYMVDGFWDTQKQEYVTLNASFAVQNGQLTQPLNLQVQKDNIQGTLKDSAGSAISGVNLDIGLTNYVPGVANSNYTVTVDSTGAFSLYLPDGQYTAFGFWDSSAGQYTQLHNATFTVSGGQVTSGSVHFVVPNKNVFGNVTNDAGTPYSQGWLNIVSSGTNGTMTGYGAQVNNGNFAVALPDGQYTIDNFYDQSQNVSYPLQVTLTVSNNGAQFSPDPLNVVIHSANVSGYVVREDGTTVLNGSINFQLSGTYNQYFAMIQNGKFSLYLPDGTYDVEGFWDQDNQTYVQLNGLTMGVSGSLQNYKIQQPKSNVTGTVHFEDGTKVSQGSIFLHNADMSNPKGYSAQVTNGQFKLNLPDGTYVLESLYIPDTTSTSGTTSSQGQNYYLMQKFTVQGSSNTVDVTVHPNNVKGTLTESDGSTPADQVGLMITDSSKNHFDAFVQSGKFALYLPDGTYTIQGYWASTGFVPLSTSFTVSGGILQTQLDLTAPELYSFQGTLKKEDGTPIDAVTLRLYSTTNNWIGQIEANVSNGAFQLNLYDGTYRTSGYFDPNAGELIPLVQDITVTNGKITPDPLALVVHPANISGTLQKQEGTKVNGTLNISKPDPNGSSEGINYSVPVNNGAFQLYLPDGTYNVNVYQGSTFGELGFLNNSITVQNGKLSSGSLQMTLPPEITGTLQHQDGTNYQEAGLKVINQKTNDSYWIWVSNGQFGVYLPKGDYTAVQIMDYNTEVKTTISVNFTVPSSSPLKIVN